MADRIDLLVFELGVSRYALRMECVREVVPAVLITPLPAAPALVEGVIDVRGVTVPVYDLRARFGLEPVPLDPAERLIVAWTGERVVAFRCDRTEWIESVAPETIEEPDRLTAGGGIVAGVARLPDGMLLIHELRAFLDEAERLELDEALASRTAEGAA